MARFDRGVPRPLMIVALRMTSRSAVSPRVDPIGIGAGNSMSAGLWAWANVNNAEKTPVARTGMNVVGVGMNQPAFL